MYMEKDANLKETKIRYIKEKNFSPHNTFFGECDFSEINQPLQTITLKNILNVEITLKYKAKSRNKENTSQEANENPTTNQVTRRITERESSKPTKNNRNPENQKEPKNHSKRKPERLHSSNQNPANKSVNWKSLKTFQKTG
ncbi:hypothetical protein U3516DRAFT_763584 [Neocallimastix sp. 'constans']